MSDDGMHIIDRIDDADLVDPQALADLMAALERVFKIGVYYPSGHAMCDQAAAGFLQSLERALGKSPSVRFEVAAGELSLQGLKMEPDARGVDGFLELLDALGIAALEIDSDITPAELHEFVTGLLAHRNRLKGARDFQQVVVDDMPPTVHVEHLEFTTRKIEDDEEGEGDGDPNQPTIEALLTSLAAKGLSPDEIKRCRRLLLSIPNYLQDNPVELADLPQVSWNEVEKLLARTARTLGEAVTVPDEAKPDRAASHVNLDALTTIFRTLGSRDDTSPRHAIDLLLTHLHRPAALDEGDTAKARPKPKPVSELPPLDGLLAAIDACAREAGDGSTELMTACRPEELSILLQMLDGEQTRAVQARIQKRLRDVARTNLDPREWDILVAGARTFLDPGREERLFGPLLLLTDAVRASESQSALAYLRDVADGCAPEQLTMLWPFFVNEILVEGRRSQPEAFVSVVAHAARTAPDDMRARLGRLEALHAIKSKRCARDVFAPLPAELCPVMAVVLESSQTTFLGERLLTGLKRHPRGWLSETVVPLLKQYTPRHRDFLTRLLREVASESISRELGVAAGQIVADYLPGLSRAERTQPWVVETVRAVGRLQVPSGARILENIMNDRRLIFLHEWPAPCREAARSARSQLRLRSVEQTAPADGEPTAADAGNPDTGSA